MDTGIAKRLAGAFFVGGCLGLFSQVLFVLWRMLLGDDSAWAMPATLLSLGVVGGALYVGNVYQKIEKAGAIGAAMPFSSLVSAVAGMFLQGSAEGGCRKGIVRGLGVFLYVLGVGSLIAAIIGAVAALAA